MSTVDKKVLRDTYLFKRKTLLDNEFNHRCKQLLQNFKTLQNLTGLAVHTFLPIEKNREVNTWPIIDFLIESGSKVIISKSNLNENTLEHYIFESKEQLALNKWGIPEPKYGEKVFNRDIDVVLIPFISFDKEGHRIGYGKGYYDRFLSECREDVQKIGLSIIPPLDKILQIDEHDIAMNACVTHLGVYRFERE